MKHPINTELAEDILSYIECYIDSDSDNKPWSMITIELVAEECKGVDSQAIKDIFTTSGQTIGDVKRYLYKII